MKKDRYESPFCSRYSSYEMQNLFSPDMKFITFRKLWVALARAEHNLGLPITKEQIEELESHIYDIDYDVVSKREKEVRHDVMAHIYAYGKVCPHAKGIIHLGATSCYVGDNTDIIIMKSALELVISKVLGVIKNLSIFANEYKNLPCLSYTHLQPAQLTTVGKRATLWINELLMDYYELSFVKDNLKMLGSKGTTGTQASFLNLFEGDEQKVKALDEMIAKEFSFKKTVPVSGQTYSRKVDYSVLAALSQVAASAMKFSNDIRILASFKEIEEPFEKHQIGSSAMPYKRNPMRSERITSIARYVIVNSLNPALTSGTQWFERTLDDSANKRISVAEAFLGVDAILNLYLNLSDGLKVYKKTIENRINLELPFMASENILMEAVKKGGDRQALHEKIRQHAIKAANQVKEEGKENDLIDRIKDDNSFSLSEDELKKIVNPLNFIGRANSQVDDFLNEEIYPLLEENKDKIASECEIKV